MDDEQARAYIASERFDCDGAADELASRREFIQWAESKLTATDPPDDDPPSTTTPSTEKYRLADDEAIAGLRFAGSTQAVQAIGVGRWVVAGCEFAEHAEQAIYLQQAYQGRIEHNDMIWSVGKHTIYLDGKPGGNRNIVVANNLFGNTSDEVIRCSLPVENLTIRGNTFPSVKDAIMLKPEATDPGNAKDVRISGNTFRLCRRTPIEVRNGKGVTIEYNTITGAGNLNYAAAITLLDIVGGVNKVVGNKVSDFSGTALKISNGPATVDYNLFQAVRAPGAKDRPLIIIGDPTGCRFAGNRYFTSATRHDYFAEVGGVKLSFEQWRDRYEPTAVLLDKPVEATA